MGFEAGDVNFYAYVGNNPINANDPSGLATQITIGYTHTPMAALGQYHQVVILKDTVTGKQFATRGGPSSQGLLSSASNSALSTSGGSISASAGNGNSGGFGFGTIQAQAGPFDKNFRDAPSSIVKYQEVGTIARDYSESVKNAIEFSRVTNKNSLPYFPLGANSNSYASTFVESMVGTRPTPALSAPGSNIGRPSSELSYFPSTTRSLSRVYGKQR
jgi:hypothetical protein